MTAIRYFAIALLAFVSFNAAARSPVPIVNHPDVAVVSGSGKELTAAQVAQAIQVGAATRGWTTVQQGEGKLIATLPLVHRKHTVMVEITYSNRSYSVVYKDSANMKYGVVDGQPVIHPFYNNWVNDLITAIRLELLKV
ncbi:MAG: hypothetical protein ACM3Y9_08180 [Ignavibacteria bacterium]